MVNDNYINDIYNGNTNFDRFNTPEHAGLCSASKVLIGAETIAGYARASLTQVEMLKRAKQQYQTGR